MPCIPGSQRGRQPFRTIAAPEPTSPRCPIVRPAGEDGNGWSAHLSAITAPGCVACTRSPTAISDSAVQGRDVQRNALRIVPELRLERHPQAAAVLLELEAQRHGSEFRRDAFERGGAIGPQPSQRDQTQQMKPAGLELIVDDGQPGQFDREWHGEQRAADAAPVLAADRCPARHAARQQAVQAFQESSGDRPLARRGTRSSCSTARSSKSRAAGRPAGATRRRGRTCGVLGPARK